MEELTKENFKEATSKGKVVVDFWAPWCGPCKMFAPIFEETAGETSDVQFVKLNIDDHQESAQEAGVRSIPTLVFYKDGQEVGRQVGSLPKDQFQAKLQEIFG